MDFLDPKKKRAHRNRLMVGYVLIGVAIGLGSMVLAALTFGYSLGKDGQITRNGLVYIAAQPQAADIFLNGERHSSRTDTRINLPEGRYSLELQREGYHWWTRDFTLIGGSIERFVYPFLFPVDLKTADVGQYSTTPSLATASPNRQWLLVQVPGNFVDFDVYDMNEEDVEPQRITLPADLMTTDKAGRSLKVVEWSTDNRHLVLEHAFEGGREYILIDRDKPEESINLSQAFGRTPTELVLRDKRYDRYYFYNQETGVLEAAELRDRSIEPFLTGVLDFKSHDEQYVVYVTEKDAPEGKVSVKVRDNDGSFQLRTLSPSDTYLLDMARFENKWYIIAGSKADNRAYLYRDPFPLIKQSEPKVPYATAILRVDEASFVSFSHNARFAVAQGGNRFAVFDMETERSYRYELEKPLDGAQRAMWMDGHRLVAVSEGKTIVFDYDGINLRTLAPTSLAEGIFFNRDYNAVFNIAPSVTDSARSAVTRTSLIVEE